MEHYRASSSCDHVVCYCIEKLNWVGGAREFCRVITAFERTRQFLKGKNLQPFALSKCCVFDSIPAVSV